jgi:hypothetical protein
METLILASQATVETTAQIDEQRPEADLSSSIAELNASLLAYVGGGTAISTW